MMMNKTSVAPRQAAARPVFSSARMGVRGVVQQRRSRASLQTVCQAAATAPVFKGDLLNETYYPTSADASNGNKRWYIIDAEGQTLGRLATLAATYIRGKHLPTYHPAMDMGAYVVVINAEKVAVTGRKATNKTYFDHREQRPGSYRIETFNQLKQRIPTRIIERAVQGMLPKGRLGRDIRLHLKVYKGAEHPHEAQAPANITSEISVKPRESAGAAALAAQAK